MQDTKSAFAKSPPTDTAITEVMSHGRSEKSAKSRLLRNIIKWIAIALLVFLALDNVLHRLYYPIGYLPIRWLGGDQGDNQDFDWRKGMEERAKATLLNRGKPIVIDGHNDLPYLIRELYRNQIYNSSFDFWTLPYHVDGNRLKDSNVLGTFWSVFVECPKSDFDHDGKEFGDSLYAETVKETYQQVDLVKRLVNQNHDLLSPGFSTEDFDPWNEAINCWYKHQDSLDSCIFDSVFTSYYSPLRIHDDDSQFHSQHKKVVSMMGAEGLHQIGNSATNLRNLYELGVRYVTLTHGCNNKYADSATPQKGPKWGGLSDDGKKIIREMNRLGMLVDLSHVSSDVMRQVLRGNTTRAPVIFSHSSAYALCPHPRNVPDDVLHLVKANNGVVMVNFYPQFVSCGPGKFPKDATLSMVADHIEYIGKLIGWEHVGIGSDFDGIDSVPNGLEDVSKFPDLTAELVNRGLKAVDVVKVMGLNVLRAWRAAEEVANKMKEEGVIPLEDNLPKEVYVENKEGNLY